MCLVAEHFGRVYALTAAFRKSMDANADEAAPQGVYTKAVRGVEQQRWMLQRRLAKRRPNANQEIPATGSSARA
jgi:hypothetical protein